MENMDMENTPGTDAHFNKFLEANTDSIRSGMALAEARYTFYPLSARQMAAIVIATVMTVKYYTRIGRDVPVHELVSILDKLTDDPA